MHWTTDKMDCTKIRGYEPTLRLRNETNGSLILPIEWDTTIDFHVHIEKIRNSDGLKANRMDNTDHRSLSSNYVEKYYFSLVLFNYRCQAYNMQRQGYDTELQWFRLFINNEIRSKRQRDNEKVKQCFINDQSFMDEFSLNSPSTILVGVELALLRSFSLRINYL